MANHCICDCIRVEENSAQQSVVCSDKGSVLSAEVTQVMVTYSKFSRVATAPVAVARSRGIIKQVPT